MQKTLQQLFDEYVDACQYTSRFRPETIIEIEIEDDADDDFDEVDNYDINENN